MRVITKGYESYNERLWERRRKSRTIGLDWLLGVLLIGWGGLGRGMAGLVHLAWPSPHPSPHSPLPNSPSSPLSTSI